MAIFDIKAGERVSLTTGVVNMEIPEANAKGMLKTNVAYLATATDQYQIYNGVRRRLFVDVSVDFGLGLTTIWLEDGPTITSSVEDWPDEIIG